MDETTRLKVKNNFSENGKLFLSGYNIWNQVFIDIGILDKSYKDYILFDIDVKPSSENSTLVIIIDFIYCEKGTFKSKQIEHEVLIDEIDSFLNECNFRKEVLPFDL